MAGFVEGVDRSQSTLFPASLEDYITEDNPVRAVDAFVDGLDLRVLGFTSVDPLDTGRPGYHPAMMLKVYWYGYLNRVPSSRRLERECQRNLELLWLTGKLAPDFRLQVRQALRNLGTAVTAAGARLSDIAKLTVLIVDHSEERLHVFGEELTAALGAGPKPTCTLIPVPRLALDGMLFEVEAVAVLT